MAHTIPQSKRPRQSLDSGDLSTSSSSPEQPTRSARRTEGATSGSSPFVCTLPPTCIKRPTPLQSSKDMETHYAKFHAHVCVSPGCSCVFPDDHLLNLHHTECHDPIAALRKDRGERIFSCFVPTCPKTFQSPKSRRLHLIEAHKYPKEYFFAVTNKGVGGLLQKWGEGASMIRGPWKAKQPVVEEDDDDDQVLREDESESDPEPEPTPRPPPEPLQPSIDDLANSMTSLSLVPNSIRFGRGGKTGGFADKRGRGRGAAISTHTHAPAQSQRREADMDVDVIPVAPRGGRGGVLRGPRGIVPIRGRGSRARGRGRGKSNAIE